MEYGTLSLFLFRARTLQCYTELSAHTTQFSNRRSSLLICLPPLSLKSQYALRMLLTELRNLHCAHNSRTSTSDFFVLLSSFYCSGARFSVYICRSGAPVQGYSPKKRSGGRLKQDKDLQLHRILILLY